MAMTSTELQRRTLLLAKVLRPLVKVVDELVASAALPEDDRLRLDGMVREAALEMERASNW